VTRPTSQSRQGLAARLRGAALDLTPLRESRPYRRLLFGDAVSVIGTQVTIVAVPIQVYDLTGSAAAVGLVGLAGCCRSSCSGCTAARSPTRSTAAASSRSRRRGRRCSPSCSSCKALLGLEQVLLLYAVVAVQAALFAVDSPARQAFVPRLLPVRLLPSRTPSSRWSSTSGVTVGPLLAGVLVARTATRRRTRWTSSRSAPRCWP
jgi:hypothetical protein